MSWRKVGFFEVMHCERCSIDLRKNMKTLSYLNDDVICVGCQKTERSHPFYEIARKRENEELLKGNFNYPGLFAGQTYPNFKLPEEK